MPRLTRTIALAAALWVLMTADRAAAQYYAPAPVVTYSYAPPPFAAPATVATTYRHGILPWRRTYVTTYTPAVVTYPAPVVSYYSPPVVSYYPPPVVVTTPAPVVRTYYYGPVYRYR